MHICFILLNDGPQLLAFRPLTDVQIATRRRQAFLLNPDGMDSTTRCSDRSYPHLDFPLLNQLLWPGLRGVKPGNLTIPIWAAPLWPIGCNERRGTRQHQKDDQWLCHGLPAREILHSTLDFAHTYPIAKKPVQVAITNSINGMHYACRGDRRLTSEVDYHGLPRIGHPSEEQASAAGSMLDCEDERMIDMHLDRLGLFENRAAGQQHRRVLNAPKCTKLPLRTKVGSRYLIASAAPGAAFLIVALIFSRITRKSGGKSAM